MGLLDDLAIILNDVASELGFDPGRRRVDGPVDDAYVALTLLEDGLSRPRIEMICVNEVKWSGKFRIEKENTLSAIQRAIGIKDIETLDGAFDTIFKLQAKQPEALIALLSSEVRELMMAPVQGLGRLIVTDAKTTFAETDLLDLTPKKLVQKVRWMVAVRKGLTRASSLVTALERNIRNDPYPEVRINNINALGNHLNQGISQNPSDWVTLKRILRSALGDSSISVQLAAAKRLGKRGFDHVISLLSSSQSKLTDHEVLMVMELIRSTRYELDSNLILRYFVKASLGVKKAILGIVLDRGSPEVSPFLISVMNNVSRDLMPLLLKTLGRWGSVDAVAPIHDIAQSTGFYVIRDEATKAIEQIQARRGVESGWVSLVEADPLEGSLSLADGELKGSVSIPETD